MSSRINKLVLAIAAATLLASPSSAATRETTTTEDDRRWIPHFSFSTGAQIQPMDSTVSSSCARGRNEDTLAFGFPQVMFEDRQPCADPAGILEPLPAPGESPVGTLRPSERDSTDAVTPFVGYTLGLSTPRLGSQPWAPRVFVSGELITFFGQERDVAKEGSPSALALSEGSFNAGSVGADSLFGVGSKTSSEVDTFGFGARVGLAFPFEFRERRLWFKPSFGWMRYTVDVQGTLIAGIKDDPFPQGAGGNTGFGPGIRGISLGEKGSESFDGIGPGIELELEAGRFGPIGVSLFASAEAYRTLGNRDVKLSDSIDCPAFDPGNPAGGCASGILEALDLGMLDNLTPVPDADFRYGDAGVPLADTADSYNANWTFDVDQWGYRAGAGIRFHWMGR